MPEEDLILITTLEQSLRQTRKVQQSLKVRLKEVRTGIHELTLEDRQLAQEIEALENSAVKTEDAIYSLLKNLREK